jgi:thiol-disulfide isomerase/thioredoxin
MKLFCTLLATILLATAGSQAWAQQQIEAEHFNLADYRGKVVYVDFWASWCTPCRVSFPFMAEIAAEQGDKLSIVAINVDEKREDAKAFLSEFATPFDIVFDPSGSLASEFKVPGMPTSFLYDRNGRLIGQHIGFRKKDSETIRAWIAENVADH